MKLWKISQTRNDGYDTYDSAIVAAETEDEAGKTSPGSAPEYTWTDEAFVEVKLIGEAIPNTKPGVILASFNAG